MLKLETNIWQAFAAIRKKWNPKRLDILTGFVGVGATKLVEDMRTETRVVFGLASSKATLPAAQIAELRKLSRLGEIRWFPGLHAKLYLFDDSVVGIGSANLTKSGFENLLEVIIISDDKKLLNSARILFEKIWHTAQAINSAKFKIAKGSPTIEEGAGLGIAHIGRWSPFSFKEKNLPKEATPATKRNMTQPPPIVRLCAYYPEWIDDLDYYDQVNWSTSEAARPGDLQLFCITKPSPNHHAAMRADAAHSLWRVTGKPRLAKSARWHIHAPFELVMRFDTPVPKAAFIHAGIIKNNAWPQHYRGKQIRELKKLAELILEYNPDLRTQIQVALCLGTTEAERLLFSPSAACP